MAQSQPLQGISTKLSKEQFEQFNLPHLSKGSRGRETTLSFHAIFNYILYVLYLGCQWKHLPIEKNGMGVARSTPQASTAPFGAGRPRVVLSGFQF
jgi:hypothetical protein